MKVLRLLSVQRAGRRCFSCKPKGVILLFVGLLVTFTVVARQYGGWDNTGNYQLQEKSLADDGDADHLHVLPRSEDTRQRALHTGRPVTLLPTMLSTDARMLNTGDHWSPNCRSNLHEVGHQMHGNDILIILADLQCLTDSRMSLSISRRTFFLHCGLQVCKLSTISFSSRT